jgi:hypothetical protein
VLLGCAFGVLAIGLVAALVVDRGGGSDELVPGTIFSTDEGDGIDVVYGPDDQGRRCTNIGAFFYGSAVGCFDLETVEETGSYEVVIPESKRKPPLVVGVMPASANAATVSLRSTTVEAETRGRWFLASLEPGVLGPTNDASVVAKFDRR